MNCKADSKENYKFDLGVEGLIGQDWMYYKKRKQGLLPVHWHLRPASSQVLNLQKPHKCLQSYLMNPKLFLTPDLCIWKINRHTSS